MPIAIHEYSVTVLILFNHKLTNSWFIASTVRLRIKREKVVDPIQISETVVDYDNDD
jgi:hypothetical protein